MPNPTLKRTAEAVPTINENAKLLFQAVFRDQTGERKKSNSDIARIKVSELISKMAFYYEKIRNSVDYKEEHLLRKNAIERILKRQLIIEGSMTVKNAHDVANHLLVELIRAAYLPNDTIPETKIDDIALVLEKYLKLRKYSQASFRELQINERREMNNWIIAIAASDIEEQLGRNKSDLMVIDHMYGIMTEHVELPDNFGEAKDRDIQIYLAIHRNYLKFDREMLSFILFKYFNADWRNPSEEEIQNIGSKLLKLKTAIDKQLDHPLAGQLNRIAVRYTVYFTILLDVIRENPVAVFENFKKDPKSFTRQIKQKAIGRYQTARTRLWRAAVRSIIYIFITKSIFVVLLEIPATKIFNEPINIATLIINVTFPAFLLFIIVLFTRLPSDANTNNIVEGVEELVFEEKKRQNPFRLRKPGKRGAVLSGFFGVFYTITFFFSFGAIVLGLARIGFNWVSIILFLFFLAFVSFFSIRIRKGAKEYNILEPKENIFTLLLDFFYVPIIQAGKFLSEKFSRINVFVFILDFIIEAPFKVLVEIAEEWTKYVRERKDDIV